MIIIDLIALALIGLFIWVAVATNEGGPLLMVFLIIFVWFLLSATIEQSQELNVIPLSPTSYTISVVPPPPASPEFVVIYKAQTNEELCEFTRAREVNLFREDDDTPPPDTLFQAKSINRFGGTITTHYFLRRADVVF